MTIHRLAALVAAAFLACAPAAAQVDVRTLPVPSTLAGTERTPSVQGTGCATRTAPCASVAITPDLLRAFLSPTFQPRDADLEAIAALATQPFGRSLLTQADAAAVRAAIGVTATGQDTTYLYRSNNLSDVATPATARANLAAAASGANTDITSITGSAARLTTARTIAGRSFDGTANITIADTDLTGAAWTTYTPTVTPSSGAFTTVSASGRYKQIGKTVFYSVAVTITTNGTAAGNWYFTLPVSALTTIRQTVTGRETAVVGVAAAGQLRDASTMVVLRYDNQYLGGNGYVVVLQGAYEAG